MLLAPPRGRAGRSRARRAPRPDAEYLSELNEAYQHFFFHYTATPLLVVETSQFDPETSDEALDDLVRQIDGMGRGTPLLRAANARTKNERGRRPSTFC